MTTDIEGRAAESEARLSHSTTSRMAPAACSMCHALPASRFRDLFAFERLLDCVFGDSAGLI